MLTIFVKFTIITAIAMDVMCRPLIVILLDGLRWDYFQQYPQLPTFQKITRKGVKVERVIPIFPPVSGPCWLTITTGLYAESHGMLDHKVFDKTLHKSSNFLGNPTEECEWIQAEPIWTTALKNNLKVKVNRFSMCNIKYSNISKEDFITYGRDQKPSRRKVLTNLLDSVDAIQEGYDLIMILDPLIDEVAHHKSITGTHIKEALDQIDMMLEKFFNYLTLKNLHNKVNVVILSDHGTKHYGNSAGLNVINLRKKIDSRYVLFRTQSPGYVSIWTRDQQATEIIHTKLKSISGTYAYRKKEIPDMLYFRNNIRAPDLLLVAKQDYMFFDGNSNILPNRATHVWSTDVPEMWAMFLGVGPNFKAGYIQFSLNLVDIYQIFAYLLDIKPQPHNGTWSNVDSMIVKWQVLK